MDKDLNIEQISILERLSTDFSRFGDEYIFARITPGTGTMMSFADAMRFEGLMMLLVRQGSVSFEINLNPLAVSASTMLMVPSRTVVNLVEIDWSNLDAYLLVLSSDFMRNVSIDLNTVAASTTIPISADNFHTLQLSPTEMEIMTRYFELFHLTTMSNTTELYVKSIARSLTAAIFYQLMQLGTTRHDVEPQKRTFSRRTTYVHEFIGLVHKHFRTERSISFYADKLFISPKYLSLVIKEATGRSAADWIDECVIIEAKNLLKFSGKSVQQIAYELNFSNQSSFGKYFKHITGMAPTKFQQS